MSEPKGRVEFSLDNRQVFFLFFGLSVVGCFVFALGVMVGRDDLGGLGAPARPQVAEAQAASVSVLDEEEGALAIAPADSFAFKEAIAEPATLDVPRTRDPEVPPRDEKLLKAERGDTGKKAGAKKPAPVVVAKAEPRVEPPLARSKPEPAPAAKVEPTPAPVAAKAEPTADEPAADAKAPAPAKADDAVMAAGSGETAEARPTKAKRAYTLQLKAFTSPEDAAKMADKLRRNGHDVRVEEADVQGRIWHRVRIGEFSSWDKALEAKAAFEKQEQVIAYVVPS